MLLPMGAACLRGPGAPHGVCCMAAPFWCAARDLGGFWTVVDLAQGDVALVHVTC